MESQVTDEDVARFADTVNRLTANIEQVIQGKTPVVRLALVCLLAEGHLLLEDVPGVGKTMLARSIAASIHASFRRVQFTPDLLPSDISGVSIYNQGKAEWEFHPGPIFANVILADEINRASPKTQAALLEVMDERRVTVDGKPYPVPRPFIVMATQNPIELEGTYRLPEAQLDRFLMRTSIGHPDPQTEVAILRRHSEAPVVEKLAAVTTVDEVGDMIRTAEGVYVSDGILGFIAEIAAATRSHPDLRLGMSPRAGIGLVRASRAQAATEGRKYVTPEDVKDLVTPVVAHRLLLTPDAELQGRAAADVLDQVLGSVAVPQRRVG